MTVEQLQERIRSARGIDGVTFTGGEPFEQAAPLARLGEAILEMGLNLVLYSGYTFEELLQAGDGDRNIRRLLEAGWLLVDGPFILAQRDLSLPYRGSRNQRLLHLPRSLRERKPVPWEAG
jgi:anaerobic ribonucleoside-triphosphate reductase activating protein